MTDIKKGKEVVDKEANVNRSIRLSDDTYSFLKEMAKKSSYEDVIRNSIARYDNVLLQEEGILGPQLAIVNDLSDQLTQCFNGIVNTTNAKLGIQQDKFDKQLLLYTDKIKDLEEQVMTRKVELAGLKSQFNSVSENNINLTDENSELIIKKEKVENEFEELKKSFDKKIEDLKFECEKTKEDLRINIKSRDDSITIKQERIDRLEIEIGQLKEENKKVSELKLEISELLNEIATLKSSHKVEIQDIENERKNAIWEKEQEMTKYYTKEIEKIRNTQRIELENMRNERVIVVEKARDVERERQQLYYTERLEKKDEKIDELRAQIIRLQQENEMLKGKE